MYLTEFLPMVVQTPVRETFSGAFLAPIDIPILLFEVMQIDLNEHHLMQILTTENQLEAMQMIEEMAEHVGMNYPDTPDSICGSQIVD